MISIGELRHRIKIQQRSTTQNSFGEVLDNWVDVATVWAKVEGLNGREFFAAYQTNTNITYRVKIRYRSDIKQDMRIVFKDKILNIKAIISPDGVNNELYLMCEEVI